MISWPSLVEPIPETQIIYEHISDCARTSSFKKVYPPNTTLIVHNNCDVGLTILGEVAKLVVEVNAGGIYLGEYGQKDKFFPQAVVIRENKGFINLYHQMNSLEVQGNAK